jgi:hypothetical protein
MDWIPAALYVLVKHGQDGERVALFLRDLERLAASLMLRRIYAHERIERYVRVLHELEAGADLRRPESPLQLVAEEKQQALAALQGNIYGMGKAQLPLLLRLDALLSGGGASYDYDIVSIEHVLPQNPEEGGPWTLAFPDEEERRFWTHKLANLVLLTRRKNAEANRKPFAEKKEKYFGKSGVSPFALTTQVLKETTWDREVLQRRQQELVGKLADEWRLHP